MEKDKFGINMTKWCRAHEVWVRDRVEGKDLPPEEILKWHEKKLSWLQHERLIHEIVMLMTSIITMFAMGVMLFRPETALASGPIFLGLLILLFCYILHYFFLENTVQHWYRIAEDLHEMILAGRKTGGGAEGTEER